MQVLQHELSFPILDAMLMCTLEYELPAQFQSPIFTNLLTTNYTRILGTLIAAETESHLTAASRSKSEPNAKELFKTLNPDKIEAALVPSFGRAVYESQVPVFRFKVLTRMSISTPSQPAARQRGFIGTSA